MGLPPEMLAAAKAATQTGGVRLEIIGRRRPKAPSCFTQISGLLALLFPEFFCPWVIGNADLFDARGVISHRLELRVNACQKVLAFRAEENLHADRTVDHLSW
jgi:hypothetical protein